MRNLSFPLSVIVGVVLAYIAPKGAVAPFLVFVIALCAGIGISWFWQSCLPRTAFILILLFALGFWRGGGVAAHEASFPSIRMPRAFNGVVVTAPSIRGKMQAFDIRIDSTKPGVASTISVATGQYPRYRYGDWLSVDCKNMKEGSCSFPTVRVLGEARGSRALSFLFLAKDRLVAGLSRALPEPHASFAAALLLGERAALPIELRDAFQATSTMHIVAVSGTHVIILGQFLKIIFGFFHMPIRFRRGAIALILLLFTAMIGAPASAVRGLFFGLVLLLAESVGRPRSMSVAIATTAASLFLAHPAFLLDLGFQLSFLAVIGIVYGVPVLSRLLDPLLLGKNLLRSCAALALISVSATVMTTPLLVATFGRLSVIGIAANMVVAPFVEPATITTLVVALLAALHPLLAAPFGLLLFGIVDAIMRGLIFFAAIPGAAFRVALISPSILFAMYAILFTVLFWQWLKLSPWQRDFSLEKTSLSAR